jgi:DNA-directed RNA polymerase subunit omega
MEFSQNIDSKFRFILVAAKRARQLQAGARPLIQTSTKKVTRVAQQEVASGLIPFELLELPFGNGEKAKKVKSSK